MVGNGDCVSRAEHAVSTLSQVGWVAYNPGTVAPVQGSCRRMDGRWPSDKIERPIRIGLFSNEMGRRQCLRAALQIQPSVGNEYESLVLTLPTVAHAPSRP